MRFGLEILTILFATTTLAFAYLPSSCTRQSTTTHLLAKINNKNDDSQILHSREPQQLSRTGKGRATFLGFRKAKDVLSQSDRSVLLKQSARPLYPEGGLSPCVIRVFGVGGGGCNAVDRMLETAVGGVDYWAINTDAQALGRSKVLGAKVLNIGAAVTRGLGAGGDPNVGRLAAEESSQDIEAMVQGTDLCFITSGMGGGTGSGAAPVVAGIAKKSGALTVAIVTKPFAFEGRRRMQQATDAINELKKNVDTVIIVSNNKLLEIIPDDTPVTAAFRVADDILRQGVVGISEIIVRPGLINVDFADVRSVMKDAGNALMGIGTGVGKTSAEDAAIAAISSPLLDEPVSDATGVVFNIMGPRNLSLQDVNKAARVIYDNVHEDANVIFGALVDDEMENEVSITVLATGFNSRDSPAPPSSSLFGRPGSDVPDFLSRRQ
ncbi:hypothetical protein MPSEU_000532900 [Mayamaea pseudoterrestris]|nr:hypothetical protein MPSEU_000532900 [Mayamaea pseudoterrestris]